MKHCLGGGGGEVRGISPKEDFKFSYSAAIHEYNSKHGITIC